MTTHISKDDVISQKAYLTNESKLCDKFIHVTKFAKHVELFSLLLKKGFSLFRGESFFRIFFDFGLGVES